MGPWRRRGSITGTDRARGGTSVPSSGAGRARPGGLQACLRPRSAATPPVTVGLDAGTFDVTEDLPPGPHGYAISYSADCSGSIAAGQTKTCTVTNDDLALDLM